MGVRVKLPSAAALNKLAENPVQLAIAVAIVAGIVYLLARQAGKAVAEVAAGVVTGDNAVTRGTVYEGAGIVATPAAIANAASGGTLEKFGSWIGGTIYDLTHDEYDPNATPSSASRKTNLRM